MSSANRQIQETRRLHETIVIDSTPHLEVNMPRVHICWNTGEEKNCASCYLSKGCKAKG